jgi:hypothetical protein
MASPPDYPDPLADSAALRLAGALRFCREPALAFARILALATATRCLTGALALAGVEAHAMNGFHTLFAAAGVEAAPLSASAIAAAARVEPETILTFMSISLLVRSTGEQR